MEKIGVTLSGGFVRAVAHAGFLKALEELGLHPSFVAGSSAGALVGLLYCAGFSPEEIKDLAGSISLRRLARLSLKGGIFSLEGLKGKLKELVGDVNLEELRIPLGVLVVDFETLEPRFVTRGNAIDWVLASCSIPPFFSPWKIGERYYIDGGIRNCLPAEFPAQLGCSLNICSNVNVPTEGGDPKSLFNVFSRAMLACILENQEHRYAHCGITVNHRLDGSMFDFGKAEEFFYAGFENTLSVLGNRREA